MAGLVYFILSVGQDAFHLKQVRLFVVNIKYYYTQVFKNTYSHDVYFQTRSRMLHLRRRKTSPAAMRAIAMAIAVVALPCWTMTSLSW